ncbi:hypothetical protein BV911_17280 [Pseudoruegeria sp. SK021]|nr:hypothetical protein BV911_17280 [Pseudoruegeria sp. SK021]
MSEVTTVGLDLAKSVFQVHGADGTDHAVVRKKLRRAQVLDFFNRLPGLAPVPFRCVAHVRRRSFRKPRAIFRPALNVACVGCRNR